jgi:NO-binding membrane sensor protein with MHYT domain
MKKLLALFDVFKKGKMVADPVAWKTGQITGSIVAGLLASIVALAKVFGYELPITDDQIIAIGTAIVAIVGLFVSPAITVASTDKIGLQPEHGATRDAQKIISGH